MTSQISMREGPLPVGDLFLRIMNVDITSYEQGGEPISLNDVGFRRFTNVRAISTSNDNVAAKWSQDDQAVRLIDLSVVDNPEDPENPEIVGELPAGESSQVILRCMGV